VVYLSKIKFTGLNRTAHNHHRSFDLLARIDGGYKFKIKEHLFLLPEARVSYLNVFEGSYTESGAGSLNLAVDSKHTPYLQPNLLVKLLKEVYRAEYCITPTLQVGWIANVPVSSDSYRSKFYKQQACKSHFTVRNMHKTINQLSLGAELLIKRMNHFLLEFGYKANFFDRSFVQHGKIKLQINY